MSNKSNLVIDQGTSFEAYIDLTDMNDDPINVAAYTANAQMRRWYSSSNTAAVFIANTSIEPANGVIKLSLTASQTANLDHGRYVYDVTIINSANTITRVLEGIVTVTPRVTR
jgi:hypothetical protein